MHPVNHSLQVLAVPVFSDLANLGFTLRREVFVQEQGFPLHEEFDQHDFAATHLVAICEGDVCGVLRILWHEEKAQISRFAVRKSRRGQKIGSTMLTAAMALIRAAGRQQMYLEAQADKVEFYRQFGFQEFGEAFLDGAVEHRKMKNY